MAKGKYKSKVKCDNCGHYGNIEINKGTQIKHSHCPKCGCKTLRIKTLNEELFGVP
jgi:Zn finger protein HypA/HybF involved in hydrogenase expression